MKAKEQPQLSEQDKAFALEVHNEYNQMPLDDIYTLVQKVRHIVTDNLSHLQQGLDFEKEFRPLTNPKTKVIAITIQTNSGAINIEASNYLFKFFKSAIQKAVKRFNEVEINWKSHLSRWAIQYPLDIVSIFLKNTKLGSFQRRVVKGMFIVHFKLYRGKPYQTEKEWEADPKRTGDNYKTYLSDKVKQRK
jgi:hypothetical protein